MRYRLMEPRNGAATQSKSRRQNRLLGLAARAVVEPLETRSLLSGAPVITEFLANNQTGIVDGNGVHSDWIEIQNQGDAAIDLAGWHLSDNAGTPAKWTFPSTTLNAGAYLIVFADSTGVTDPAGYLHTNFSLSTDGENLTFRKPDNTIVSEFNTGGANFPKQFSDISYGTSQIVSTTTLLSNKAPARAIVPTNSSLDSNLWTQAAFNDSSWLTGTTGVGFDGGGTASSDNLVARWSAQSLNSLADGAKVSSWPVASGTGTAVQASTSKQPILLKNQLNGRSLVRFDGIDDQLKITNQSLNGDVNFTIAFVFRTSALGASGSQWYNNSGIVDAEVGGVTNDWGMAISSQGSIGAGVGNPDTTLYSDPGLNDGNAHVVVFTKSGTATSLSIDGGAPIHGTAPAGARTINELMLGSLHTNINYFNGDIGEVRLYNAALTDDGARSLSYEMSNLWGLPIAAGLYTPVIGLDLQSSMSGLQTTADVRVPFTFTGATTFQSLSLNVQYDDGFVAYLNGTEIARRNAPSGAILYTGTATTARDDAASLTSESIDISSFANLIQGNGAPNVLAFKLLNSSLTDSDTLIIPQLVGTSVVSSGNAYMTTPTPGAANLPGYVGLAGTVTFSVDHGYFSNSFTTTLTAPSVGSTLVYTLDGSDPTLSNGTVVLPPGGAVATTKTLTISSTSVIRAVAFLDTYLPSEVAAESYMFVADIVQQPEYTPAGAYWDVGMDTDVVNATQTYSVQQALTAIPTMSFSLPAEDMFGPGGIYVNPLEHGEAWERAVSVEYFDPNNKTNEFSINAGVRIEGGVSRQTSRPKKSFKLFFRAEYGASTLDYPVFGAADPEQSFDHLVLRAGHSYSWANLGGTPAEQADYLRDQFARDTQEALDGQGSLGNFVQLYINGQYWGLYNLVEEVDANYAAARFGGSADDYDIVEPDNNGGVELDSGTLDAWNNLFNTADAAYADGTINSVEYASLSNMVDMKSLADYMLGIFYRGDHDAPVLIGSSTSPRNFLALHNHNDPNGKFYFQTWDGEISLDDASFDRTEVYGNTNPGRLYQQLRTNTDFRQLMSDEIYRTFYNNGPLTVAANQTRYQSLVNEINVAIVGESARWGNALQSTVMYRDNQWLTEINWILNTYMPQRSNVVLAQLTNDYPEFTTKAPGTYIGATITRGGVVPSGTVVTLLDTNSPTGTIYYTLNGSDPRLPGGAVSSLATTYAGGFPVNGATHLEARVLKGSIWSPLVDLSFTVTAPLIRVSELMYNPPAPGPGGPSSSADDYEFLELYNAGATTVSLAGIYFDQGIDAVASPGATLAPGARGVIVRNIAAFQYAYGTAAVILGTYDDKLSDGGEEIRIFDPNSGTYLVDFTYKDSWYKTTDGGGYSMIVTNLTASQVDGTLLGDKANWAASSNIGGSPGQASAIASVAARNIYYNNSSLDGNSSAFAAADDAAIATDKTALLPGQTAAFANYTSYNKGINGIMVDLAGLNAEQIWAITPADLSFRVSVGQTPTWTNAPTGATIAFRKAAGTGLSDRLSISFPDNAIVGKWLEVTVATNARTGLTSPDVFYFGNAPGESGNSPTNAIVDITDELAARNNPRTFFNRAPANFPYDYNRDGLVNATDEIIARNAVTTASTALPLFTAPTSAPAIIGARWSGGLGSSVPSKPFPGPLTTAQLATANFFSGQPVSPQKPLDF